jgi:hypothetical protein
MNTKREALVILLLVLAVAVMTRVWFPKTVTVAGPPIITRVVDTVHDTLTVAVPAPAAAGTPNLVIRETHHELVLIAPPAPRLGLIALVAPDTTRPRLYPVLSIDVGARVGDTTRVTAFGLQRGDGVTSLFYTPGPLRSVVADSAGTPVVDWYAPPAPGCEFGCKVKLVGTGIVLGASAVVVLRFIFGK